MARGHSGVGQKRREQIIDAAVAIIAEQGLHELTLSAIESRTGMKRGQLTYYFRTKEDILVGVFDHMMDTMRDRARAGEGPPGCQLRPESGWGRLRDFLTFFLLDPPELPEFHELQYTFLSQVRHRDDFRQRLAGLYAEWRSTMTRDMTEPSDLEAAGVSARTFVTFIQALLHGLAIQRVADPASYDRQEMLTFTMFLLKALMGHQPDPSAPSNNATPRTRTVQPKEPT